MKYLSTLIVVLFLAVSAQAQNDAITRYFEKYMDDDNFTEVSTTSIYYKDWETHSIRRSFTCQFHPELMADIRDIGKRDGPRYAELKDNDGARLFIRLLYHGMQE